MDSEGITPKQSLPTLLVFHHDLKALDKYIESENCHGPIRGSLSGGGQERETVVYNMPTEVKEKFCSHFHSSTD